MKDELKGIFGVEKPVIGMIHFPPLPGTPLYESEKGIRRLVESIEADLAALQQGGVNAVMFGNEGDRPYKTSVGPDTVAVMASAIAELKPKLSVPFGVDVLWDPMAAIALAKATEAQFAREVFTGVFAGDLGMWDTACGDALRYRRAIDADHVKLLFTINAEFAAPVATRDLRSVARSVAFSSLPDVLCVSGPITGESSGIEPLKVVKEAVGELAVFANTGVTAETAPGIFEICDGAVVGTFFKKDGITWNNVDAARVQQLMGSLGRQASSHGQAASV